MKKKLFMVSLGCSKNQVDSEVMLGRLQKYEMTDDSSEADAIIVNTCGFIDAAKQESINTILALHGGRKEDSKLVMAGCLSERYKDELQKELTEVDIFTGVADYSRIDELIEGGEAKFTEGTFLINEEDRVVINSSYHAYIKISEGCNQTCSFCAIPSFKGKLFSRSEESIVKEIAALNKKGYFDFSIVAQDSSSYKRDSGVKNGLTELIKKIDAMDGDFYARVLYLYPSTVDDELIDTIVASKRFVNYFDMPVQHISDKMLRIMKRGAGKAKTIELLEKMRAAPQSYVRTSIIVGHPGESDEDFEEALSFIEEFDFDGISVFEYSDEEGTDAYEMTDKVNKKTITKRLKALKKVIDKKAAKKAKESVGKSFEAVFEGVSDEHEFLLKGKKKIWAPEIDGELLINESEVENPQIGALFKMTATGAAKDRVVARIDEPA
ncbi:MAG TPA: 30S ribosomal protein S12 methylthiotransferase RimO [Campylobacterales bacterium]|nr:30S ribosomal protein S12 methylthiotransferase RimO [Campylobacterales bacterium]